MKSDLFPTSLYWKRKFFSILAGSKHSSEKPFNSSWPIEIAEIRIFGRLGKNFLDPKCKNAIDILSLT